MQVSHRNPTCALPDADEPALRVSAAHLPYIGKLAKPSRLAVALADKYLELFGCGQSAWQIESLHFSCHNGGPYELALIFIDQPPEVRGGMTWFCLEEIGPGAGGNWHYLTLDQLILCEAAAPTVLATT